MYFSVIKQNVVGLFRTNKDCEWCQFSHLTLGNITRYIKCQTMPLITMYVTPCSRWVYFHTLQLEHLESIRGIIRFDTMTDSFLDSVFASWRCLTDKNTFRTTVWGFFHVVCPNVFFFFFTGKKQNKNTISCLNSRTRGEILKSQCSTCGHLKAPFMLTFSKPFTVN